MRGQPGVAFRNFQHPRGRGGRFIDKPGVLHVRGRGGRSRPDMPPLSPQREGLRRTQATLDAIRAALRGKVPEHALATFYGLFGAFNARFADSPLHPHAQDPNTLLDWIANAQTSLRLVGRALAQSPELLTALVRLLGAYERDELPDGERALVEAWAREGAC